MNKKHIPIRSCLICKKKCGKNKLIRLTPENEFYVLDKPQTNQARGIYLCYDINCFSKLLKHKKVALASETKISTLNLIKNKNVNYLNILKSIKNSGHLVFGMKMVCDNLQKIHLLFIANDINAKNKNNLIEKCKENDIKYIFISDKISLGYIFDKNEINVIGIINKKIAKGLCNDEGGLNEN